MPRTDLFGNPIVGIPEMANYNAGVFTSWFLAPRDLPPFTFDTIRYMLFDETVRLGIAMRQGVICNAMFGYKTSTGWVPGVKADNQDVADYVERQVSRIWQYEIDKVLRCMVWGWSGGEIIWKLAKGVLGDRRDAIEFDYLIPSHARDIRTVRHKKYGLIGVEIQRNTNQRGQNIGRLGFDGKGWFASNKSVEGSDYGESDLFGAYSAFADKWFDGGANDVRRLFMHSDAYRGRRIGFPVGTTYLEGTGEVPNQNLARQMVEQYKSGDVMTYPLIYDVNGREKWRIDDTASSGGAPHILQYPQDLDKSILRGMEIPDDIITSELSGAWQGKKVPLMAFFISLMRVANRILKMVVRYMLEPAVMWNFGKAEDFEVTIVPFDVQAMLTERQFQQQLAATQQQGAMAPQNAAGGATQQQSPGGFGQLGEGMSGLDVQQLGGDFGGMAMSLFNQRQDKAIQVLAAKRMVNEGFRKLGLSCMFPEEVNGIVLPSTQKMSLKSDIAEAARETDKNPTLSQIEAGNYKKGKVALRGLSVAIENPKGSTRTASDGSWSRQMHCHYGYILGTRGRDGDHIDVFLGDTPDSEIVFVIDQLDEYGEFDEHKCMVGFINKSEAIEAYKSHYPSDWIVGEVTPMTWDQFVSWIEDGSSKYPVSKTWGL